MPSSGVAALREIDEQAGLWLGGTLQRRSWLQASSSLKDNCASYFIFANYVDDKGIIMNMINAGMYVCFRCIIKGLCICPFLCDVVHLCMMAVKPFNFSICLLFMFMGLFARLCFDFHRVLFAG